MHHYFFMLLLLFYISLQWCNLHFIFFRDALGYYPSSHLIKNNFFKAWPLLMGAILGNFGAHFEDMFLCFGRRLTFSHKTFCRIFCISLTVTAFKKSLTASYCPLSLFLRGGIKCLKICLTKIKTLNKGMKGGMTISMSIFFVFYIFRGKLNFKLYFISIFKLL